MPKRRSQPLAKTARTPTPAARPAAPVARRAPPTIRLQLAGLPRLAPGDGRVHELERHEAALLALIALDGPTPRGQAAALLWGEADTDRQRSSLRQRLFQLRRRSGCHVIPAGEVLTLAPGIEHDLAAVKRRLAGDVDAARGPLLGDFDYSDCPGLDDWVRGARERWSRARLDALAEIAAGLEAEGRVAPALAYAERLVAEDPTLEHAHRRLMRLHYLRGDRAAALGAFERCRQALLQQLGVAPGAETRQLAQLIEHSGALPPLQATPMPIAILRPPRLVERDRERMQLAAALASGRSALVGGEPGIGKTRLLEDHAARVEGAIVVPARPGDARLPYAVMARTLRALAARFGEPQPGWLRGELARVVPELGTANPGRLDAGAFQRAVADALSAWAQAGLSLVVLDDAQYADEATLAALPALCGGAGAPVAWCIGCRAGDVPALLDEWRHAGDRDALTEVRLGPLDPAAVEALLEALEIPGLDAPRWAQPLWRHTGGNPLFVLETLRALIAGGLRLLDAPPEALPAPHDVGALIARRLEQLTPGALALARVTAIAGLDFSVELAAHVAGRPVIELTEAWRELESAQVIRDRGFAHDLLYEVVLRSVPEAIAQALHRAVAAFLQAAGKPAARVASHWREAQEWAMAAAAFETAADDALRHSRREDELRLVEQAIDCAGRGGDAARAFALRTRAVEPMLIVRTVDAALALTERLLLDATTDEQRLQAQLARASTLLMASRFVDAAEVAGGARTAARRLRQSRPELDAVRLEALALANSGRAPQAVEMLHKAEPRFEKSRDLLLRYKFATDYGHALSQAARWPEAVRLIARAVTLAEELGDVAETIVNLTNLAGALGYVGRIAGAVAQAERARALRDRMGTAVGAPMAHNDTVLGMLYVALGRYREALLAFELAGRHFRAGGAPMWIAVNENHRALALVHLGQEARAIHLLARDDGLPRSTRARRWTICGRAEQARGRPGAMQLRAALELLGAEGSPPLRLGAQLDLARELAPDEGVALCRQTRTEAMRLGLLALAQSARIREVDGLVRSGDAPAAAALAQSVLAQLEACHPSDLYLAEAWSTAYRALDSDPAARGAARETLQRGQAWVREVAARHVPEEFRDSFLHRNPVNRSLLTASSREPG
jgi:DNA-binding SARP family transcriptional activator